MAEPARHRGAEGAEKLPAVQLAYTVPQAAKQIGVSAKTLWRRHADGEIAFVKWHGRTLVRRAELERVLDSLEERKAA